MNVKTIIFLGVCLLGVVLDQVTKIWVFNNIEYGRGEISVIPGFLSIVHAQNPGAAMGLLRDFPYRIYLFLGFTVLAVGFIVDMFRRLPKDDRFLSLTLGLILSGAVGNAIDRIHKQTVTDFIRVYTEWPWLVELLRSWGLPSEWPSFNVADAALVVGVGLFLVHYLFLEEPEEKEAPAGPKDAPPPEARPPEAPGESGAAESDARS